MAGLQGTKDSGFSITIPAIACSFPCAIHPNAQHLIEVANSWVVDRSKPIAAAWPQSKLAAKLYAADQLVSSAVGLTVTLYFANAVSEERVIPILKLMGWYFMLDNCVDEPSMWGDDLAMSTHLIINSILAVIKPTNASEPNPSSALHGHGDISKPALQASTGAAEHVSQELAHILARSAAEWWSDMCVDLPLSQQLRFCEAFRGYLSSILEECPFRSAGTPPDMQSYLRIRAHTLGWYPVHVLVEHTLCMELGQDAMANPLLKALQKSVCESVMLVNDVASFRREYESGDYFNIIAVLCWQKLKDSGCADRSPALDQRSTWQEMEQLAITPELLQESMNEACEMVKERDQQCVRGIKKIKESPELMQKPGMGAYLEALGNHVGGNVYWHFATGRYGYSVNGDNYKPAPDELEEGMARALVSRTLILKNHPIEVK